MNKWISVDDIIAEQKKYCLLCEGEEETTHCSLCFARDIVSAIIHHTDGIDLVHCRECMYHEDFPTGRCPITCSLSWGGVFENDFCSYGERKESEENR